MYVFILAACCLLNQLNEPTSYNEARQWIESTGQRGLIIFSANWCKPCQPFKDNVIFPLYHILNQAHVIYVLDIDKERPWAMAYYNAKLWDGRLPAVFFLTPGGRYIHGYKHGAMSYNQFVEWYNSLYNTQLQKKEE